MAGMLRVSPEEMEAAALECAGLAEEIEACKERALQMNLRLQEVYEGEAARSFEDFIVNDASPILLRTSEMCEEIAGALRHTAREFADADSAMAGMFRR
jgi:WXG100 family type VII secretion target